MRTVLMDPLIDLSKDHVCTSEGGGPDGGTGGFSVSLHDASWDRSSLRLTRS